MSARCFLLFHPFQATSNRLLLGIFHGVVYSLLAGSCTHGKMAVLHKRETISVYVTDLIRVCGGR